MQSLQAWLGLDLSAELMYLVDATKNYMPYSKNQQTNVSQTVTHCTKYLGVSHKPVSITHELRVANRESRCKEICNFEFYSQNQAAS